MAYGLEIRNNSTNHVIIDETYAQPQVDAFHNITSTNSTNDVPWMLWDGTSAYEQGYFVPIDLDNADDIYIAPQSASFNGIFYLVLINKMDASQAYDTNANLGVTDPYPNVTNGDPMIWVHNSVGTYTFTAAVTKDPKDLSSSAYIESSTYGINIYNSSNQLSYTTQSRPTKYIDFKVSYVGQASDGFSFSNLPSTSTDALFATGFSTFINYVTGGLKYGWNASNPRYRWNGPSNTIAVEYANYRGNDQSLAYDSRSDALYAIGAFGDLGWTNWT
tara:strand:+ start:921 stop:1745 length:825 start_codon:yes stop_codon:yes gene_type:complete